MALVTYAVYRMWRKRLSCKEIRSHHQQLTAQAPLAQGGENPSLVEVTVTSADVEEFEKGIV